jgi:glucose/arabinose dehydrogenase
MSTRDQPGRRLHRLGVSSAVAAVLAALLLSACGGDDPPAPPPEADPGGGRVAEDGDGRAGGPGQRLARAEGEPVVRTLVEGLEVPWEIVFLPDGRALVTERPGRVRVISANGELVERPAARVPVSALGEGGLLGLALDPKIESNDLVYTYYTTESGMEVARYRLEGDRLVEEAVVLEGIAAGPIHDSGRIHFGPDDRLYIATGDAGQQDLAQDPESLNGKFLVMEQSEYRGDGPGDAEILTSGHRNPQGFDWQPGSDRLIATEHGDTGNDEVNEIREGRNYGWPEAEGTDHGDFTAPLTVYEDSIAPSGATFVSLPGSEWTGDYLIAALVGEQVRRLSFDGAAVTEEEAVFEGEFGRVRTVAEGPDGALYALTSNRDGRGSPRPGDDRVIRIVPPAD